VRAVRIVPLALVTVVAAGSVAGVVSAAAGDRDGRSATERAAATVRQAAPAADNPCTGPDAVSLRCPDLIMRRPFGLRMDRTRPGRLLLRAGNSIDSVGDGPAVLRGVRSSPTRMRTTQLISRTAGGVRRVETGGQLEYKLAHLGRRYWKFRDAARFELWALDAAGTKTQVVRTGPKVAYCLRDLDRTRPGLAASPRRVVFPACSTNRRQQRVTLGTSVGWSDVYPPTYPEQWIDVTGLRGCFAYVHTADPGNAIHETDEDNNVSQVIVRLPFRRTAARGSCPGRQFGVTYRPSGAAISRW
jgi:hypothetical protein